MHNRLPGVLLIFLLCNNAIATTIDKFAYQAELTSAPQQLQSIELPVDILLNITSGIFQDLVVFDANNKVLPGAVQIARQRTIKEQIDLNFYVFDSFQKQHSKTVTRRAQNQQDGELTELETIETVDTHQLRQDYLIELPKTSELTALELEWAQEPVNQLLQVKLEAGTKLDNLHVINPRKTLSNINGAAPEWRFIKHIPQNQKYLRVTAVNSNIRFKLLRAIAHYSEKQDERLLWHQVKVTTQDIENKTWLSFDSPSVVAARALQLIPTESHSTLSGDLYASQNEFKQKQRVRNNFRQHNIESDDVKPDKPVLLPSQYYRHWWMTINPQTDPPPMVELAYPIYEFIFLGNNNGPYTLAWGNYQSQKQAGNLSELLNGTMNEVDSHSTRVSLKTIQISGGKLRLAAEPEIPWKQWLLWVLLILAALVTGRMAFGLYREMNQ